MSSDMPKTIYCDGCDIVYPEDAARFDPPLGDEWRLYALIPEGIEPDDAVVASKKCRDGFQDQSLISIIEHRKAIATLTAEKEAAERRADHNVAVGLATAEKYQNDIDALEARLAEAEKAYESARDAILHDRGPLEGEGMDTDKTNAVLAILDEAFAALAPPDAEDAE